MSITKNESIDEIIIKFILILFNYNYQKNIRLSMSGLIILSVFIIYTIIISFVLWKVLTKLFPRINTKKTVISIFIVVMTFPYLDLIAQKGIKSYFEITGQADVQVFSLPEKDEQEKISSLNLFSITNWDEQDLKDKSLLDSYKEGVSDFIEVKVNGQALMRINLKTYEFEEVKSSQARYVYRSEYKEYFLFTREKTRFFDLHGKKTLGEISSISFQPKMTFLREKVLLQVSGTGNSLFHIQSLPSISKYRILDKAMRLDI